MNPPQPAVDGASSAPSAGARLATLVGAAFVALVLWGAVKAADVFWPVYGLRLAAYSTPASWAGWPTLRQLDATLSNDLIGRPPFTAWRAFSLEWTGALAVPEDGDYTFSLTSDDGSTLEIDGAMVVDNGGAHLRQRVTGTRRLAAGVHPIRVRYFQGGDHSSFTLLWTRTTEGFAPIPAHRLLPEPMSDTAYRLRHVAPLGAASLVVVTGLLLAVRVRTFLQGVASALAPRLAAPLEALGRPWPAVATIVAAGVVLRLLSTSMPAVLWPDSALFYETMREIVAGDWTSHDAFRTLIYPQLMALVLGCCRTPAAGHALITVQHALGLLSAVLFYFTGRRAFSPHVALAGALALVLHPVQLFYELSVLTETLFTCALATALWLTARALERPDALRAAGTGLATAVLVLVRPVAQYFLAWPLAAVALAAGTRRRRAALAAVVVASYAALVVPLMALNQRQYGFFGVSLGQGLGLYTRVFHMDELAPSPHTRYPALREVWRFAREEAWSPNRVHDELNYARDYTAATADAAMYAFARETVLAQPVRFGLTTAWRWVVQAASPISSVRTCTSAGGRYLCSGRMEGESLPPFPNLPARPSRMREAVVAYARAGALDMRVVVLLAAVGVAALLTSPERTLVGALLAATIVYVVLVPAASQLPQDRYRLPVDALFFMFAARGAVALAGRLVTDAPAR